jgi:signal transduction histidine kinase/CheY-like chemotaxis protein
MRQLRSLARYWMFTLLAAATLTVVALGWFVARDFRQSAEAADQLYDRFGDGLDLIDNILFETGEVRRILLYALHTSDANRQLEYVDQSRAAEAQVRRLLEGRSAILSTEGTWTARESVAAAWTDYLQTRDEVIGLILEGSLSQAVALDEAAGTARFNRVRNAIASLKASFEADAAAQVEAERGRSTRATRRLILIVLSALFLVAIGVYLVNRRASLEVVLRVKSDFLTTMSHELRTPLTGVIGITDLLQTAPIPRPQRELVRMLRTNATTLLALVNNVLDYSRIDAGLMVLTPRRFSLDAPVEEALDSVSEVASRKGLALGYVIDADVPDVVADEDRVRQVVLNLLSNAVKYTEAGEVAIRVSAVMEPNRMAAVTISVRDTGIGIREDLQEHLFQWFSRIETTGAQRVGGTGLGLAISDRLSRLLGGSMTVESHPGKGSTFTFVFRAKAVDPNHSGAAAPLPGMRVMARLSSGIISEQVLSMLRRWKVEVSIQDGSNAPDAAVSAVVVDGRGSGGTLYDTLLRNRAAWGWNDIPIITIAEMGLSGRRASVPGEHVVATPIRMQTLHDALLAATSRTGSVQEPERTARPRLDLSRLAVLVVEDNEPNRRVIRLMLNELGIDPDEAASGHDAIDAASRRRFDVILMDVQMPDLDGLEATRRIRAQEQAHRATIVALTANVLESDEARCRAAGMDAYLQKPVRLATLSDTLNAVARLPS